MKSIGHEETFAADLHTHAELHRELVRLSDAVAARLRAHGGAARTLTLKVRFAGFATITRSVTVPAASRPRTRIVAAVEPLLRAIDASPGVRLLGVSASNFASGSQQLSLDDLLGERARRRAAMAARGGDGRRDSQAIRRHGDRSGQCRGRRGLRVVQRGAQQWGPDEAPDLLNSSDPALSPAWNRGKMSQGNRSGVRHAALRR